MSVSEQANKLMCSYVSITLFKKSNVTLRYGTA